ncbi:uncharacterized protein E5676_scaffold94G00750 [Cucumis melo var. makuwa]|uniref:Reverse transcriptase domain-containing protein n=1 Tax=Cucumis melo var. makuwa TaxID=1194695 RepID=A0A5A7U7R7_CUCMM|nr:uncharacterized protein E6C27_scaffold163G00490 [Cucumis melo var. makuwa]TYK15959.1 uncharacterized protein E5676_scaffold94G00750 [Cucumis melo var. makuwa]
MLHKYVEFYVDDLVVKSKRRQDYLKDLKVLFDRLRKYQLRMNPLKCAFGVTSGKFIGFIIRHRGIKIDQSKIDAIQKMLKPKILHDLRSLQEQLTYIRRSLGALLAQEEEKGKEHALYYLSRTLFGVEVNYSPIEKMCLALLFAINKLRHYMHAFMLAKLCSSNVAEYLVLIIGLQMALKIGVSFIEIYGDSKLIINKLSLQYDVKHEGLKSYFAYARQLMEEFDSVMKKHVSRIENKRADALFKQYKSSMYKAAANGLAEAFNKTLCNLLKKIVSKLNRDCQERMVEALWAYRTTYRTPTGVTPYLLVYGVEVGDLVLVVRRSIVTTRHTGNKFTPKWDGPYIVKEVYTNGAYKIVDRASPLSLQVDVDGIALPQSLQMMMTVQLRSVSLRCPITPTRAVDLTTKMSDNPLEEVGSMTAKSPLQMTKIDHSY